MLHRFANCSKMTQKEEWRLKIFRTMFTCDWILYAILLMQLNINHGVYASSSTTTQTSNLPQFTNTYTSPNLINMTSDQPTTTTSQPHGNSPGQGVIAWPSLTNTSYERELIKNRQALEGMILNKVNQIKGPNAHTHPPPIGSRVEHFVYKNITFQKLVTDVSILVYISRIDYMDMESQSLTFAALVNLTWQDLSLTWDPQKDSPLRQIMMDIKDVWNPYILPDDIQDFLFIPDNNQVNNKGHKVVIQYDGLAESTFWATFTVPCDVNVMTFPFDTHRCHLRLSQMYNFGEKINFIAVSFENNTSTRTALYNQRHAHREWDVLLIQSYVKEKGKVYAIDIDLRRKSVFYAVVLIMPCFILNMLSFLMFLVPIDGTERINLALELILSYFVLLMIMIGSIPPTGKNIPLLGMYLSASTAVVLLNLSGALLLHKIYKRKVHYKPISKVLSLWDFSKRGNLTSKCFRRQSYSMKHADTNGKVVDNKSGSSTSYPANQDEQTKIDGEQAKEMEYIRSMDSIIYNINISFFGLSVLCHVVLFSLIAFYFKVLYYKL